ncbi:MAG: hypothetical protein NAG76_22290 [Candidatus Pristimantibacillus lignocellulolyticus]|uniref:Uncharacterized protein n=1 Tax=Candidatus Pristimantibacillus lignocellulolyticus TaxID=2994561 RepID=A0A9J6ZF61_9BACL|nr:MAG: hypothetical protein NAG76_22290 [Candidatus Pristimantibacillus lignocellulolyticus]
MGQAMTKWNQELLWVARNERNEIIRVQDEHPSVAVEVAEGIQAKVKEAEQDKATNEQTKVSVEQAEGIHR